MALPDSEYVRHLSTIRESLDAISSAIDKIISHVSNNNDDSIENNIFSVFIASQIYYFAMSGLHKTNEADNVLSGFIECMPWLPKEKLHDRFEEYLPLFKSGLSGRSPTPFYSLAATYLEKISDYSVETPVKIELCLFLTTIIDPSIIQTTSILREKKGVGGLQPSGAHISLRNDDDEINYHAKRFVNSQQNQRSGCLTLMLCGFLFSLFVFLVL